jgi:HK97 family phage portal protein
MFKDFIARTLGRFGFRASTPDPTDDFWYRAASWSTLTGLRVSPEMAVRLFAVHSCRSLLARTVGTLPLPLKKRKADGRGSDDATSESLYRIFQYQANPVMTAAQFRSWMESHLDLYGNAFAQIVRAPDRSVSALWPIHPARVRAELMPSMNAIRFTVREANGRDRVFLNDEGDHEIFHVPYWLGDGVLGRSPIEDAPDLFSECLIAQEYSANFLRNEARPGIVLEAPGELTEKQRIDIRNAWQEVQGGKNRGKPAFIWGQMKLHMLGASNKDAQLLELRTTHVPWICGMFGVPPGMIGWLERAQGWASREQSAIDFVQNGILPRCIMWEQAIQRDLIQDPRFFVKHNLKGPLRADAATQAAFFKTMFDIGVYSPNMILELLEENPIGPEGDTHYCPANMLPLGERASSLSRRVSDPQAGIPGGPAALALSDSRLLEVAGAAAANFVRRETESVRRASERHAADPTALRNWATEYYAALPAQMVNWLRLPAEEAQAYAAAHRDAVIAANGSLLPILAHWDSQCPAALLHSVEVS